MKEVNYVCLFSNHLFTLQEIYSRNSIFAYLMLHFDFRIVHSAKKTLENVFRFNQVSAVSLEEKTHLGPKARGPGAVVSPNFTSFCDPGKTGFQCVCFFVCTTEYYCEA